MEIKMDDAITRLLLRPGLVEDDAHPAIADELRRIARRLRPAIAVEVCDHPGLMVPDLTNVVLFRRPT